MKFLHILRLLLIALAALAAFPAHADYSNTVQSFKPIAYWPLNETNQPPPAPITETNLGTLGALGNGKHSGLVTSIPGILAGDADTADDLSSASITVPYSPALTFSGPFSVEGWFNPEN